MLTGNDIDNLIDEGFSEGQAEAAGISTTALILLTLTEAFERVKARSNGIFDFTHKKEGSGTEFNVVFNEASGPPSHFKVNIYGSSIFLDSTPVDERVVWPDDYKTRGTPTEDEKVAAVIRLTARSVGKRLGQAIDVQGAVKQMRTQINQNASRGGQSKNPGARNLTSCRN